MGPSEATLTAVVLAAGGSRRFGAPNKLGASLAGRPLLAHVLDAARRAKLVGRIVVVTGPNGELPVGVDPEGTEVVPCSERDEGMAASLRRGIEAADGGDALILLGDQPLVEPEAIDAVIVMGRRSKAPAVRAVYAGQPGHPVLLKSVLFDRVRALRGDSGARELLRSVEVAEVELDDPTTALDVDTPADLARAEGALRSALD